MRRRSENTVAHRSNVRWIDLQAESADGEFDVVLVNSVIQYLGIDEIEEWLARWRRLLCPEGVLIISDVCLPRGFFAVETAQILAFSLRKGIFWKALAGGIGRALRHRKLTKEASFLRITEDDLEQLAFRAGLSAERLPHKLTFKSRRFSLRLRPR